MIHWLKLSLEPRLRAFSRQELASSTSRPVFCLFFANLPVNSVRTINPMIEDTLRMKNHILNDVPKHLTSFWVRQVFPGGGQYFFCPSPYIVWSSLAGFFAFCTEENEIYECWVRPEFSQYYRYVLIPSPMVQLSFLSRLNNLNG